MADDDVDDVPAPGGVSGGVSRAPPASPATPSSLNMHPQVQRSNPFIEGPQTPFSQESTDALLPIIPKLAPASSDLILALASLASKVTSGKTGDNDAASAPEDDNNTPPQGQPSSSTQRPSSLSDAELAFHQNATRMLLATTPDEVAKEPARFAEVVRAYGQIAASTMPRSALAEGAPNATHGSDAVAMAAISGHAMPGDLDASAVPMDSLDDADEDADEAAAAAAGHGEHGDAAAAAAAPHDAVPEPPFEGSSGIVRASLAPLHRAATTLAPDETHVTPALAQFCRLCILARHPQLVLPLLSPSKKSGVRPFQVVPKQTGASIADVHGYSLYGGTCLMLMDDFEGAGDMFAMAVCAPPTCFAPATEACYKRMLLSNILADASTSRSPGDDLSSSASPPKLCGTQVAHRLRRTAKVYHDLHEAYVGLGPLEGKDEKVEDAPASAAAKNPLSVNVAPLRKLASKAVFVQDGTAEFVNRLVAQCVTPRVLAQFASVYTTARIADVDEALTASGVTCGVEQAVLTAASRGLISAALDMRAGLISFLDPLDNGGVDSSDLSGMGEVLSTLRTVEAIAGVDEKLAADPAYALRCLGMMKSERRGSAGGGGEDVASDEEMVTGTGAAADGAMEMDT